MKENLDQQNLGKILRCKNRFNDIKKKETFVKIYIKSSDVKVDVLSLFFLFYLLSSLSPILVLVTAPIILIF